MEQRLSVNKAAHLLGVRRNELQRKIREGILAAEDGMVAIDELQRIYPSLMMGEDAVIEELELIKKSAFSRRVSQRVMPDADELELQLKKRNKDLGVQKARAEKYKTLLMDLLHQVERWREDERHNQADVLDAVCDFINARLREG